ncbi:MAG TPA: cholesterol oxidase substrate-binding domain-containing protein [Ilumatobacteraceae bacterium]|nr:cholesterol oxidase substrate-binding domain-containing protein [Ilumatobacteraceae bacterium]
MGLSRRSFLVGSAAAVTTTASGWSPLGRILSVEAQSTTSTPAGLPNGLVAYKQRYENWSGEIRIDALWTCDPTSPSDVVALANWAQANGWRLRPKGFSHNWSPLTVDQATTVDDQVLLIDLKPNLKAITVNGGSPASVTVGTGASMDDLLLRMEQSGYGFTHNPAPGDLTVGGVLAIDGHGTAIPANGETRTAGHTYGSLSNLIVSLTAVVWDAATGQYVLRTCQRNQPEAAVLAAHVGRALLTEVTLRVGANKRVRCQSYMDVPTWELFAAPGSWLRTADSYLKRSGRIEVILFPFTSLPWLKVWTPTSSKPWFARQVDQPYNYPFSDSLSPELTNTISQIQTGAPWLAPTLGSLQWSIVNAGLTTTNSWDLWGWSKNTSLYVKPTTLRVTANGYAVLCKRADVQRVLHEFWNRFNSMVTAYRLQGKYPMNGPLEIRVTGLDQPSDIGVAGARAPQLSATRPRADHPEWDCAVWLDVLTLPGTPYAEQFYRELEQWCLANYTGNYASVRVEWSKGWGYTDNAAWSDPAVISGSVPASLTIGQPAGQQFADARATLNALDPHRIYTSPLLEQLLP